MALPTTVRSAPHLTVDPAVIHVYSHTCQAQSVLRLSVLIVLAARRTAVTAGWRLLTGYFLSATCYCASRFTEGLYGERLWRSWRKRATDRDETSPSMLCCATHYRIPAVDRHRQAFTWPKRNSARQGATWKPYSLLLQITASSLL